MLAHVERGRVVRIQGDPDHPITRGFLCAKVNRSLIRMINSDRRILQPMVRDRGGWSRIGWDEALDLATDRMAACIDRYGPLSILYYPGAGNMGVLRFMGLRFFNLLGGVTTTSGSLCDTAGRAGIVASYGRNRPHDPEDVVNSRLVIIWGRNPAVTNIHILPFLREARKQGAVLVLVDPRVSETARHVDIHLRPRPGTDHLLSLGIAKGLIDSDGGDAGHPGGHVRGIEAYRSIVDSLTIGEVAGWCDVSEEDLATVARLYATLRPATILAGMGVQHFADGAETLRAIGALPVLSGNVGMPGGGISYPGSAASHFDLDDVIAADRAGHARRLPKPIIGAAIEAAGDPPIRYAWIAGANPVLGSPNSMRVRQALDGLDFVVVCEMFLTDTAECADLVLPVSSFLERDDLVGSYGHNWVGPVNRASLPAGGARSDLDIYQLMAGRFGFGTEMAGTTGLWLRRFTRRYMRAGITFDELMSGPHRDPHAPKVPFQDLSFPTDSGRYELINPIFQPVSSSTRYPYRLITTKPGGSILSGILPEDHPPLMVANIHPEIAGQRSVEDGSICRISSHRGSIRALARLDDRQRTDIVCVEIGGWMSHGHGINILTDDRLTFQGECACYNETTVMIEPEQGGGA